MRIRTLVEIDYDDGSVPVRHELWRDIPRAEAQEYQYPERPFFEAMNRFELPIALMDYQRQIDRNKQYVQMISTEIATAFGRALGNRGPDDEIGRAVSRRQAQPVASPLPRNPGGVDRDA